MDLDTESGNVFLLEFTSQVALNEGRLLTVSTMDSSMKEAENRANLSSATITDKHELECGGRLSSHCVLLRC